jgi:hypothetical protein
MGTASLDQVSAKRWPKLLALRGLPDHSTASNEFHRGIAQWCFQEDLIRISRGADGNSLVEARSFKMRVFGSDLCPV